LLKKKLINEKKTKRINECQFYFGGCAFYLIIWCLSPFDVGNQQLYLMSSFQEIFFRKSSIFSNI